MSQHLVTAHGEHLLRTIKQLSEKLKLTLDGEATIETPTISTRKLYSVDNQRKLTPAKYEAWKLWQQDGLSVQRIAVRPHDMDVNNDGLYIYTIILFEVH